MNNKKGVSVHLEMILAFVIFILFVTFLLAYIRPYEKKDAVSDAVLVGFYDSFKQQASVNLTTIFIRNTDNAKKCISIADLTTIDPYFSPGEDAFVKKVSAGKLSAHVSGTSLVTSLDKNDSAYLLLSTEFTSSVYTCNSGGTFEAGVPLRKLVLSRTKLTSLSNQYTADYNDLKTKLNIPENIDYAIIVKNFDGVGSDLTMDIGKDVVDSQNINVVSKSYYEELLKTEDGTLANYEVILKLW
ncbi:MAG: hypothetical protein Q7S33_00895 [Nanoarchaeota archaeon]|nr:hypothetical protein [Nanoarchaeota archaeon]